MDIADEIRNIKEKLWVLPDRQRECVMLRFFSGLTFLEISVELKITRQAAQQTTKAGIEALRGLCQRSEDAS